MRATLALFATALLFSACGDEGNNGVMDMSMTLPDGAVDAGADLASASACNPTDPMTDGQECDNTACPAGSIGVIEGTSCKCRYACDPANQSVCPCNRRCVELFAGDAGSIGAGCLFGLGAGERCGAGVEKPCAQRLTCAGPAAGTPNCLHECEGQTDCPQQTVCAEIRDQNMNVIGKACQYISGEFGQPAGANCQPTDACTTGHLCEGGTCKPQCDGPGATCAVGTCQAFVDTATNKTVGYVCK